jgi:CRP-like cAMP-binding protein
MLLHPIAIRFLHKLLRHTKLNDEEQHAFLSMPSAAMDLPAHGAVIRRGQEVSSCCLVADGLLAKINDTLSGQRQITALHIAGDMSDIHTMMMPQAVSTLIALTPSTVLRLPRAPMLAMVVRYPVLGEALWRETVRDSMIATEWVANVGARLAMPRLAHLFCEMAVRNGADKGNAFAWIFPITQMQLGETTGMSTVHVNRSLQALRKIGVMSFEGQRAIVGDWTQLQSIGEFDGDYLRYGAPVRLEPADA